MTSKEYVTAEEVARVCEEMGLDDWSRRSEAAVSEQEAAKILSAVNTGHMPIPLEDFRIGLEVELEHGTRFKDANVTNNHPILTGKIVLAHLKETMDYYRRLDVAEIEGDLLKAVQSGNLSKITAKYRKLIEAQKTLSEVVADQLRS